MEVKAKYIIDDESISREIALTADKVNTEERHLGKFLMELGKRVPFDTGWLPPGVRSYRQVGDMAQAIIVQDPGVNMVRWGQSEGQQNKPIFNVAQPWRVIAAQYVNQEFRGARMFYSPVPVNSPQQPLYHQNLPNLNCLGYNGNGVGWVCLYHNQPVAKKDLAGKIINTINRCSGDEPYNNANMSATMGPTLYKKKGKPVFMYDPQKWETKTEAEGVDWICNEDLLVPVLVKGLDDQNQHYDGGQPLTVDMLMRGKAPFYYHDKPDSQILYKHDRGEATVKELVQSIVTPAFVSVPAGNVKAKVKAKEKVEAPQPLADNAQVNPANAEPPPPPQINCGHCGDQKIKATAKYMNDMGYYVCADCMPAYGTCNFCSKWKLDTELQFNNDLQKKVCTMCTPKIMNCPLCKKDVEGNHTCDDKLLCHVCTIPVPMYALVTTTQPAGGLKVIMHAFCEDDATACGNCGIIVKTADTTTVNTVVEFNNTAVTAPFLMCPKCWTTCPTCSLPSVREIIEKGGECATCLAATVENHVGLPLQNPDELAVVDGVAEALVQPLVPNPIAQGENQ